MDNQKIGKLIAQLRNRHGLTQQDLGDKIGVGFRAVSKWERGINLPDIANMTELSKIFGISLDELMAGELKEKEELKSTKKLSPKIVITITIILIIIIVSLSTLIYRNNKTYTYNIISADKDEYYVNGQLSIQGQELTIVINELGFLDNKLNSTIITNYEYDVKFNEELIFGYGYNPVVLGIDTKDNIENINKTIRINFNDKTALSRKQIENNNIEIIIKYLDESDNEITKEIKATSQSINYKNNN